MKKVTMSIAGLLFVVVALASIVSAADVIHQNIAMTTTANGGNITMNASNAANAGPGSIVNQTISQKVAHSKISGYHRMPSLPSASLGSKSSISQSASNVANAGPGSIVYQ